MAAFAITIYGSTSLVSWISSSDIKFTSLMTIFTVIHILSSLLSLFCMREVTDDALTQDNTADGDSDTTKETSEQIALTSNKVNDDRSSYYGDIHGFGMMSVLDFWLLSVSFIISIATDKTFFMNIGTYLRSFGQEQHLTLLTVTGPLAALVTKLVIGPISDACLHKVSRICFFIVPAIVKIIVLITFLFFGDHFSIMLLTSYTCYVTMGSMFVIGPILSGEYFGLQYYGRNFGTILFATGIFTVVLHVILGIVYDWHVNLSDEATCLGLDCFRISTITLTVLTGFVLCTSLLLWKRAPSWKYFRNLGYEHLRDSTVCKCHSFGNLVSIMHWVFPPRHPVECNSIHHHTWHTKPSS